MKIENIENEFGAKKSSHYFIWRINRDGFEVDDSSRK